MKSVKIIGVLGFVILLLVANGIALALWPFMWPGWSLPDKDLRFYSIFFLPVFSFLTSISVFLPISRSLKMGMGVVAVVISLLVLFAYFA